MYVKLFKSTGQKEILEKKNNLTDIFYQKNVSRKVHRKTPLLESYFIIFLQNTYGELFLFPANVYFS